MSIDNFFYPMLILTNYNNKYKKLLNKLKSNLRNSKTKQDKNNILNDCKKEINKWYFKLMIKCFLIGLVCLVVLILLHFLLNLNEIWSSCLILVYIFCFALDKYHEKENTIKEIEKYASEILIITDEILFW